MQAIKLPTWLEGEALAVWLELSEEAQKEYETMKKAVVDGIRRVSSRSVTSGGKTLSLHPQPECIN